MWGWAQGLVGNFTRKQQVLYEKFKAKAAGEGKTAIGKTEELIQSYVNSVSTVQVGSNTSAAGRALLPEPGSNSVIAPVPAVTGSLQFELEKTKAVLQAAFDLSDMLRPEEPAAPQASETDKMIQTLLTVWMQGEAAKRTGGTKDMELMQ